MLSCSGLPNSNRVTTEIDITINRMRTMWCVDTKAVSIFIARLISVTRTSAIAAEEMIATG